MVWIMFDVALFSLVFVLLYSVLVIVPHSWTVSDRDELKRWGKQSMEMNLVIYFGLSGPFKIVL